MTRRTTFTLLTLALTALAPAGKAGAEANSAGTASPALARFQALVGDWVAAEDSEMVKKGELVARYALTAGGSAVVETVFPGSPHEMVTVYAADGADVVLNHYCLNHNAPRMRARSAGGASRLEFAFDGGLNIQPAVDKHMHSAWIEFVGPDELKSQWTELEQGKTTMVVNMHTVRKNNG